MSRPPNRLLALIAAGLLAGCTASSGGSGTSAPAPDDPAPDAATRESDGEPEAPEEDSPVTDDATLAPDFSLPGSDGKTYNLADFKGKQAVVVAWYPVAFTGG